MNATKTYLILCGWCAWRSWSWMITASNNTSSLNQNVLTVRRWASASTCYTACTAAIRIITAIQNMLICGLLLLLLKCAQIFRAQLFIIYNRIKTIKSIDFHQSASFPAKLNAIKCILSEFWCGMNGVPVVVAVGFAVQTHDVLAPVMVDVE